MNLTARLMLLVGLAVSPALAIEAYNLLDLRRTREAEVRAEAARSAELFAADVTQAVESVQRFGLTLAQIPTIREAAEAPEGAEACRDLLLRLRQEYPGSIEVGVADGQGRVVCTSQGVRSFRPVTGDHFRRAVESNAFVIGGYGESAALRARYLTFAQPIRGEGGKPVGAVLLGLDLADLAAAVERRFSDRDTVAGIADRNFVTVLRVPDDPAQAVGRPAPPEGRAIVERAGKGVFEARGRDGFDRLAVITPLAVSPDASPQRPDLLLAIGVDRAAALAPIDAAERRGLLLLALSLAAALLAGFAGIRFWVRGPVERLLLAARHWRKGDYATRTRLSSPDEFGRLGEAFDAMASKVDERERAIRASESELRRRTRELEAVLATVPAGVWFTYDPAVKHVLRNRKAAETMGVPPDVDASFSSPGQSTLRDIQVLRDGAKVEPDDMPLQRVMRGEAVHDEEYVFAFPDGAERTLLSSASRLSDEAGRTIGAVAVSLDITDRKRAEEQRQLLIHELNHRVKNTLATVQSIARQTFRGVAPAGESAATFESRLLALSRAHDLLTKENWEGADLQAIVEQAVEPYEGGGVSRFDIEGPPLALAPRIALALAMALHELCTNAAKYGALSAPGGRVRIEWRAAATEGGQRLRLRWEESGGPPVAQPERRGFGTRLIERQLAAELDGLVLLDHAETGVVCTIEAPLPDRAALPEPEARTA